MPAVLSRGVIPVESDVARTLTHIREAANEMKINPPAVAPANDCTDELLQRAKKSAADADEHWD